MEAAFLPEVFNKLDGPRYLSLSWSFSQRTSSLHSVSASLEMKKRRLSGKKKDIISDMPQSLIDTILMKLPIRDAVRTSILSTKWRFQWATMTQLVFDENCVPAPFTPQKLTNFVMACLFLHDGPIHKFKLFTPCIGCPLLESFEFSNDDQLALTVDAPNLKHLTVNGTFKDLYLKHTPLLAAITVDFFSETWEGDVFVKLPITFNHLKFIKVEGVNYKEMKEVSYVHHLLLQSPYLQELHISLSQAAPIGDAQFNAADLDLWDKEGLTDFKFMHLEIVKMWYVSNEYDKKFIKFVLGRSPMLQMMSISLDEGCTGKLSMVNEVLHFRRASPKVDINFFD
ncbi:hypothetical protein POM88_031271 [Heracleum sosnowskyi]|uniref:FBD domain-containing protein n=1 Tax=Heracleum sosnowskyi TaxID=360622 RepID=A0AAD8MK65_9APIA|nr:hypothetical protein POM88_031271 [Heracleum sosnowskyi]